MRNKDIYTATGRQETRTSVVEDQVMRGRSTRIQKGKIDEGRNKEEKKVEARAKTETAGIISGAKRTTRSQNASDHAKKLRGATKDTKIVASKELEKKKKYMSFEEPDRVQRRVWALQCFQKTLSKSFTWKLVRQYENSIQ